MPNRLHSEKSPYLLQHAHNPVDWYPWGEEAFARAREEDRLIFLSIGYSTCHWCHVMERESFENQEIAALMNEKFVSIKVDREERPDIDRIYMSAIQATGQDGGWPLSIFLTPALKPVWGGTYFPPESRGGRAGFPDILRRVDELWHEDRSQVLEAGERLSAYLTDLSRSIPEKGTSSSVSLLEGCFAQFQKTFDAEWGGFGSGPKFPRPSVFFFLLRYYSRTRNAVALEMVGHTLQRMTAGGINDQIGGGFHRYAVDREWRVPHFEKMLYDQAQIILALTETAQLTRDPRYARSSRGVCDYVLRELTHPDGGFFSAEDADSPIPTDPERKGEGAYYLWASDEVERRLGRESEPFSTAYGIKSGGNIPFDPHQEFGRMNIPYLPDSLDLIASQFKLSRVELDESLSASKQKLLQARSRRPRPLRDDKVLASWNGMMISALSKSGGYLREERYLQAARRGADFVFSRLYDPWSRVLRKRFRDGEVGVDAHLEDYAFLANGFLDLYEATGEIAWFRGAVRFADDMVAGFWDAAEGGFFTTDGKDQSVLVRLKEQYDGAEPGGNSVALLVLLRLGRMTGNPSWVEMAGRGIEAMTGVLATRPVMLPFLAGVIETLLAPPMQIVLAGDPAAGEIRRFIQEIHAHFLPSRVVYFADGGPGQAELAGMVPELAGMSMLGGKPTAYLCRDFLCTLPTTDPGEFADQLARGGESTSAKDPPRVDGGG